jgi:hypothetical protein
MKTIFLIALALAALYILRELITPSVFTAENDPFDAYSRLGQDA